jgi:hypothetical protein
MRRIWGSSAVQAGLVIAGLAAVWVVGGAPIYGVF